MGKSGITFNDVAPAMITGTGMIPSEEQLKGTPGEVKNIPVGRSGSTEECANVVTMLCRTGYMNGQSLLLSGGLKWVVEESRWPFEQGHTTSSYA
jgi:3-oxoacyl-[acyl-carrier protein] reductase